MASEADRVRQEIEATRQELARDVDRLAERVSPARLAHRRLDRLRSGVTSMKDRVVGASEESASTVADAAAQAPSKLARLTQGSPVAVGVIAFGGGLLAAALLKESKAEREAARHLGEALAPVVEPLQAAGRAFAEDVRSSVGTAAGEVRSAAVDAAAEIGVAASAGAAHVRDTAVDAATHTLREATERGRAVAEETRRDLHSPSEHS